MSEKFFGTIEELQKKFSLIPGDWTNDGTKITFRSKKGGILNYWPKSSTIQFQGQLDAQQELKNTYNIDDVHIEAIHSTRHNPLKIFIVHGHDTNAKDQLELCLHRLGLTPYAIMNDAGNGKTLIEALEGEIGQDYSSGYGIVLMTPDDMGYAVKNGPDSIEPRARQNVILEMGMLFASLKREKMMVIIKGHLEIPSDIEGLIRVHYNNHIKEVAGKIAQNLQKAGFDIPPEKITIAMS